MKQTQLPPEIRSEINRLAHARAQIHEIEQRRQLQAAAIAQLQAGQSLADVLASLVQVQASA